MSQSRKKHDFDLADPDYDAWTNEQSKVQSNFTLLQDSETTQPTTDGSASEDEVGGWLGSFGTDFRNIATCFTDSTLPVLENMATLVHKTAMTVAAEIAQLERDSELEADTNQVEEVESLPLPWEIRQNSGENGESPVYLTDEDLMDDILSLSKTEGTFSAPFKASETGEFPDQFDFTLDDAHVALIRRLLDADSNLATMHARLSGRTGIHEVVFWSNYFYHCGKSKENHLEKQGSGSDTDNSKDTKGEPADGIEESVTDQACNTKNIYTNSIDDSSLKPISVADDSSYVKFDSAPNSLNSLTTTRSYDDIVFVGRPSG